MRVLSYAVAITATWAALAGSQAWASVIAEDTFAYPAGDLNGRNGGSGWTSAWTATTSVDTVINPGGLAANGIDGGTSHLAFSGNEQNGAYRSFTPTNASPLYVSFLIDFSTGALGSNDFLALWLDNGGALDGGSADPNIGIKVNEGDGGGPSDYFVRLSGSDGSYTDLAVVGTDAHLVGRLSNSGSGVGYNQFDLWVNPTLGDLSGVGDAVFTQANGYATLSRLGFRTANLDPNDQVGVDHLVLADAAADVMVPEPMTLAVWSGLAVMGFVAWKRRG